MKKTGRCPQQPPTTCNPKSEAFMPTTSHKYMQDSNNGIVKRKLQKCTRLKIYVKYWSVGFPLCNVLVAPPPRCPHTQIVITLHPTQRGCGVSNASMTTTINVQMSNFFEAKPKLLVPRICDVVCPLPTLCPL